MPPLSEPLWPRRHLSRGRSACPPAPCQTMLGRRTRLCGMLPGVRMRPAAAALRVQLQQQPQHALPTGAVPEASSSMEQHPTATPAPALGATSAQNPIGCNKT